MDKEQRFLEAQKLYQKQITDLEAKLAESESKVKVKEYCHSAYQRIQLDYDKLKNDYDKKVKLLSETLDNKRKLQFEFAQLKQQLAEKNAEVQSWKDGTMVVKLGKLEEQIAEKEKVIVEQKIKIRALSEENFLLKDDVQMAIKIQNKHDIEQNQTAIAELEKILEFMKQKDHMGFVPSFKKIKLKINQQITELKGEKYVKNSN